MDKLPPELSELVVDMVNNKKRATYREDLKSLRLASKSIFADLAASFLFETLPLWISLQSLRNLSNVAEHTKLSKNVKHIQFSPLRIKRHHNREKTLAQFFERETDSLNDLALRHANEMANYHYYLGSQDSLAKNSSDEKIMTRAFKRLPNLKRLSVARLNCSLGAMELLQKFAVLDYEILSMEGEYTLPVLAKAVDRAGVQLELFTFGNYDGQDDHREKTTTKINKRLNGMMPRREIVLGGPLRIEDAFERTMIDQHHLMEKLRIFRMRNSVRHRDGLIPPQRMTTIRDLLGSASNLERLNFVNTIAGGELLEGLEKPPMPILVSPQLKFPLLKRLHMAQFKCTTAQFSEMLSSHACTHETIWLHDAELDDNDWRTALEALRNIKYTTLTHFALAHDTADWQSRRVAGYVTCQNNEQPLVDDQTKVSHLVTYVDSGASKEQDEDTPSQVEGGQ